MSTTTYNLSNTSVNFTSSTGLTVTMSIYTYTDYIYYKLLNNINNVYGVCGLMGNLYAESHIVPFIKQNDVPPTNISVEYSKNVTNGVISESDFVNNGLGYGLAQWTYYTRKQGLYNLFKNNRSLYDSIGNTDLAFDFLIIELQNNYSGVYNILKTTDNIRTASNAVLHNFENPADQSISVELLRNAYSEYYYSRYSDKPIPPTPPEPPTPSENYVTVNPKIIQTKSGSTFTVYATIYGTGSILWTCSDNIEFIGGTSLGINCILKNNKDGWVTANLVDDSGKFLYSDTCNIIVTKRKSNILFYNRNLFFKFFS